MCMNLAVKARKGGEEGEGGRERGWEGGRTNGGDGAELDGGG